MSITRSCARHPVDGRPGPHGIADPHDQLQERGPVRAHGVDGAVPAGRGLLEGQSGQVVNVDGSDPVVPPASDEEHRQAAEQPHDVVDQHPVPAEQNGRPQDRVRHSRPGQGLLDQGLAPKVGKLGRGARVSDAHMDDALYAGLRGGLEQRAGVGHG